MTDMQQPLKIELDKVNQLINEVHQLYNLYFQGAERLPPHNKRKDLELKMHWVRAEVFKKSNAALTFALRQLEARYQSMHNRWDKTMSEIESGKFRIPPRKK
jgi:predicted nuclease with TOPRIM domain